VNIKSVANSAALLATALATGGHGGFAYEADTGALYYAAKCDFSAGGTQVALITTDGTTAWTYSASHFTLV
jgi:hypothetical protein